MNTWHTQLSQWLFKQNYTDLDWPLTLAVNSLILLGILVSAFIAYRVIRKVIINIVTRIVQKTRNTWDDEILKSRLLNWLALLAPAILVQKLAPATPFFETFIAASAQIFIIILAFLSVCAFLNIIERIYRRFDVSRELPIKGMLQVIKMLLLIATIIFVIATMIGKSPVILFSGLGAMTAIIMLIFKDSILGLVAGIQLSANRMVARGDWIEMPKFGADGEVLEVALTTVKIQNWDKTITTIPTYSLISDSFKNWRGMSQAGVRRIKRHIYIDLATVGFLTPEDTQRMHTITILKPYLEKKEKEIAEWNAKNADPANHINARALSNIGTFRAYVDAYLRNHPKIAQNQTRLVRQLQPTDHGLPIELYVFTTDNAWANYESIQSDIIDHLLSVLPEFNLRPFQRPSDSALRALAALSTD